MKLTDRIWLACNKKQPGKWSYYSTIFSAGVATAFFVILGLSFIKETTNPWIGWLILLLTLILVISSIVIDNKKGYNMTYGGGEYIPSEETRKKMSASQKKRFLNLDELEKMRQRTIEQFNDPQKRENHKNSQIKRFENPEEIQKYRIKMIKYFEDNPKFMENHSNWMKEYYKNPLSREKVSIATKEAMARPKVRENFLCGIKKSMENPERRKKCGNGSRGKHWYHKGSISKFFFDNNVPVGWELGRS